MFKTLRKFLVVTSGIILVLLILAVLVGLNAVDKRLFKLESSVLQLGLADSDTEVVINESAPITQAPKITTFRGTLRKEETPKELDLPNKYRYILYFEEPYLLKDNAVGYPLYIESIEVFSPRDRTLDLDPYDDLYVEVAGILSWGLAETRIIEAVAVVSLE